MDKLFIIMMQLLAFVTFIVLWTQGKNTDIASLHVALWTATYIIVDTVKEK